MPRSVAKFRHSVKRAGRAMSFQRPLHHRPHAPDRPPPPIVPPSKNHNARPNRSFPNLSRFVERRSSYDALQDDFPTKRPHSFKALTLRRSSTPTESQPLSTSTISTSSSSNSSPTNSTTSTSKPSSTNRRLLSRISSSQRIRRLSFGHRSRKPPIDPLRASSFNETYSSPRAWASSGPSFLSQCSDTEDSLSWSRFLTRSDVRDSRLRRRRYASYSCSDFEIAEDTLVEIGTRLPDRTNPIAEEDVFGRRRGDVKAQHDVSSETSLSSLLATDVIQRRSSPPHLAPPEGVNTVVEPYNARPALSERSAETVVGDLEKEETIRGIAKAIESSKGRLSRSANMNKAFQAVIESGDGFVSKRQLVENILTTKDPKDPSMVILFEPDSAEHTNQGMDGRKGSNSEDTCSANTATSGTINPNACPGFSTSMTAKQCAATLETILREMACRVTRYTDEEHGARRIIRLKAVHIPIGTKRLDRKVKVMVIIREEDRIRTSVAFKRVNGIYSSRDSHVPLCGEIRRRFQREWPAMVEALYVRFPEKSISSLSAMRGQLGV